MRRIIFPLVLAVAAAVGCHGQLPPATQHSVTLTWSAPVGTFTWGGCTTASPCVYAVYRCAGTASACGTLSSTAWAEVTTAATRPSGVSYQDLTVSGGTTYSYAVETVQGNENSGPSNVTTATVPQTPVAPAIGSPTVAKYDGGPLPKSSMPQQEASAARVTDLHIGE